MKREVLLYWGGYTCLEVTDMEWLARMNDALVYLEENLDGEVSLAEAARIACCSQYHFQRMFSYVIGVPLSEYLRRRRLTKAAADLQNGGRVTDVALRYGYDSPTAFNRAFQAIHGISPSAARQPDAALKAFPPVSLQITVKGVAEIDYRIVEKDGFRAVGVRKKVDASEEEFFVVPISSSEEAEVIALAAGKTANVLGASSENYAEPIFTTGENSGEVRFSRKREARQGAKNCVKQVFGGCLGLFVGEDDGSGHYYLCAETDAPVPEGMSAVEIPGHTWAVFPGVHDAAHIENLFRRIFTEWRPAAGYDFAAEIEMEVYTNLGTANVEYEIWMPVVKIK
jgi:AraC family transcriptional regulator